MKQEMKNLHVLPTDKSSRFFNTNTGEYHFREHYVPDTVQTCKNHNIYITSDEEIKEGDWVIYNNELQKSDGISFKSVDKKIILTTDQSLNGVQAIDDEFLEWFVKNPSCEEVDVEKTFVTNSGLGYQEYAVLDSNFKVIEINAKIPQTSYYLDKVTILNTYEYVINYKLIIPKEENSIEAKQRAKNYMSLKGALKPKQETLEEFIESYVNRIDRSEDGLVEQCLTDGAKWQAERMYSEAEVKSAFKIGFNIGYGSPVQELDFKNEHCEKWFKQFKKK